MGLFNWFGSSGSNNESIKEYLQKNAVVVDVRTPMEFQEANVQGSVNIPLHVLEARFHEIKEMNKPIVAVCRSGARSGNATIFLKRQGIDVINGGPWQNVASEI